MAKFKMRELRTNPFAYNVLMLMVARGTLPSNCPRVSSGRHAFKPLVSDMSDSFKWTNICQNIHAKKNSSLQPPHVSPNSFALDMDIIFV